MFRYLVQRPSQAVRQRVIVMPADADIKRIFERFRPILNDGPVPVQGELIGWSRTQAGPIGAIFVNPLSSRRTLWGLDFQTRKPRCLVTLT